MPKNDWQAQLKTSQLSGNSAEYLDNLYEIYLKNPADIPTSWQDYFSKLPLIAEKSAEVSHETIRKQFIELAKQPSRYPVSDKTSEQELKQAHVFQLINAYRTHGHHEANLDPLGLSHRLKISDLDMATFHLTPADFNQKF